MTVCCPKCGSPMAQKSRIAFPSGPAKLVYACSLNPNHVSVVEDPDARQPVGPRE